VLAETDDNGEWPNCLLRGQAISGLLAEIQEIPDTLDDDEEDLSAVGTMRHWCCTEASNAHVTV